MSASNSVVAIYRQHSDADLAVKELQRTLRGKTPEQRVAGRISPLALSKSFQSRGCHNIG